MTLQHPWSSFLEHSRRLPLHCIAQLTTYAMQDALNTLDITCNDAKRYKKRNTLVHHLLQNNAVEIEGVLDISQDGFGFIRGETYLPCEDDVYVSPQIIQQYGLKIGDVVKGCLRSPKNEEHYLSLESVESVNFQTSLQQLHRRPSFERLTAIFPEEKITLEPKENPYIEAKKQKDVTLRAIDIMAPIGFGQRSLVVAPPKTGKTELMKKMAQAIATNHPEAHVMVLLVDERPEEATEMRKWAKDVASSTFDEPAERHVKLAEIVIEKAKRLVEMGYKVVLFLDSITRLARAYNTTVPSSGKVLTGGVDSHALQKPKRFFGAARNTQEAGSLTIIATALIETSSRMDDVIFEEFKGTGNMEITLDRAIAEKRIYPAININKSSTRREEALIEESTLNGIYVLRRVMHSMGSAEATEFFIEKLQKTRNNKEFFETMRGASSMRPNNNH